MAHRAPRRPPAAPPARRGPGRRLLPKRGAARPTVYASSALLASLLFLRLLLRDAFALGFVEKPERHRGTRRIQHDGVGLDLRRTFDADVGHVDDARHVR